jgi:hypothetical protein
MHRPIGDSYIAECFWSGVRDDDVRQLDRRIETVVAEFAAQGDPVSYLGAVLIVDDEVVLCLFEGPAPAVRRVLERAGVAFDRILRTTRLPWPRHGDE